MICEHCGSHVTKKLTPEKIIEVSSTFFNRTFEQIKKNNRARNNVYQRQVVMTLLSDETDLRLIQIGKMFGKDHTTVIYAKKTIHNLADVYTDVKDDLNTILSYCKQ